MGENYFMRTTLMQKIWLSWIDKLSVILFCFLLGGCASSGTAIPQSGPTMAEVYADAMHESNGEILNQVRTEVSKITINNSDKSISSNYTRTSENEINNLFPQLQNPQLVMYVHPHLNNSDEAPIPGYSTAFSLYEKNYYAMPGE